MIKGSDVGGRHRTFSISGLSAGFRSSLFKYFAFDCIAMPPICHIIANVEKGLRRAVEQVAECCGSWFIQYLKRIYFSHFCHISISLRSAFLCGGGQMQQKILIEFLLSFIFFLRHRIEEHRIFSIIFQMRMGLHGSCSCILCRLISLEMFALV